MAGIVEYDVDVAVECAGDVLDIAYGAEHRTV